MGRRQDKYCFKTWSKTKHILPSEAHKTKMLQSLNNPFLGYAICKNKNGFTELLSWEQCSDAQPWEGFCSSDIPQLTVPMLMQPEMGCRENSDGEGSKSTRSAAKTPLEFGRQACLRKWNSFSWSWLQKVWEYGNSALEILLQELLGAKPTSLSDSDRNEPT